MNPNENWLIPEVRFCKGKDCDGMCTGKRTKDYWGIRWLWGLSPLKLIDRSEPAPAGSDAVSHIDSGAVDAGQSPSWQAWRTDSEGSEQRFASRTGFYFRLHDLYLFVARISYFYHYLWHTSINRSMNICRELTNKLVFNRHALINNKYFISSTVTISAFPNVWWLQIYFPSIISHW